MWSVPRLQRKQRGNVLFLILIAVALFAALSYAITQSGRGGGAVDRETAILVASKTAQYPATIRTAVTRMILAGTPGAGLNYNSSVAANCTNCVFSSAGGGATYQCSSNDQNAHNSGGRGDYGWRFRGINGTASMNPTKGFYIKDIGSNTDVSGRDAFAYLPDVPLAACQQINRGLGLSQTPENNSNFLDAPAVTYNLAVNVIYSNPGNAFACVNSGGYYSYYHALIEQ